LTHHRQRTPKVFALLSGLTLISSIGLSEQVIGSVNFSNFFPFEINVRRWQEVNNLSKNGSAWNCGIFAYYLEGINSFSEANPSLGARLVGLIDNLLRTDGDSPTLRKVKEKNVAGVEKEFLAWTSTAADPRYKDLDEIGLYPLLSKSGF
jgi:hypothetical protein